MFYKGSSLHKAMTSGQPLCCNCRHMEDPDIHGWFFCKYIGKKVFIYSQCATPEPIDKWLQSEAGQAWLKWKAKEKANGEQKKKQA